MPQLKGSILRSGEFLMADPVTGGGDWLASPDYSVVPPAGYTATMYPVGNLTINPVDSSVPVWSSNGPTGPMNYRALMQSDGEFTIQGRQDARQQWQRVWGSNDCPNRLPSRGSEFFAMLRNDGNLAVFQGTDTVTNGNGIWTTAVCLHPNGTGCVIAPQSYGFGAGDFTIECWVALGVQPIGGGSTILSTKVPGGGSPADSGFIFSVTNDGAFHFALDNGYAFYSIDSARTCALDGNFHHIAVIRREYLLSMYFDTQPLACTPHNSGMPDTMVINNDARTVIAGNNNGLYEPPDNFLTGQLAELRIWEIACSQDQLFANCRRRLRYFDGLLSVWPFSSNGPGSHPFVDLGGNNGAPYGGVRFLPSTCPADFSIYPGGGIT
jgi:hypothetical protein